jgi:hypothetical protein
MDDRPASSLIRWTAVLAIWVAIFVVAAVVGGLISRQGASVPPIAAASPTPVPTMAPIPTPTPTLTPGPSPSPSVEPSATSSLAPAPPSPTATAITPSPSVIIPSADPSAIPAFLDEFAAAIERGRDRYLLDHLHPAVIERFGTPACRAHIAANVSGRSSRWEFIGSSGPAPWPYASDDLETIIPDAWTVSIREPDADPEERDLHFAYVDGTWRWFTDCGDPV